MCFVTMTSGIDLSVGATAAMARVVAAHASPYGMGAGLAAGVLAGLCVGIANGLIITRLKIMPFITMLAAAGLALFLAGNQTIPVSYKTAFSWLGQGNLWGLPVPALIAALAFVVGAVVLNLTSSGRTVLAVGDNEDGARLMGLPADRVLFGVYLACGGVTGLTGVILAAQFGAGQPIEGKGWELFATAAVMAGGTLLTGGSGSVLATLAGVLLLGVLFTILNFENDRGGITLSAYWQSVIRGLFLLAVVMLQACLADPARHLVEVEGT